MRMQRGVWAYGGAGTREYVPVPRSPKLQDLGSELEAMFVRAFVAGHQNPADRPTAPDWVAALHHAENSGAWLHAIDRRNGSRTRLVLRGLGRQPWKTVGAVSALGGALCLGVAATHNAPLLPVYPPPITAEPPPESRLNQTPRLWQELVEQHRGNGIGGAP